VTLPPENAEASEKNAENAELSEKNAEFGAGWVALRRSDWFVDPGRRGYILMLSVGLVIGVVVEWTAVHVMGRWAYGPRAPMIPIFDIGLTPVAQMLAHSTYPYHLC